MQTNNRSKRYFLSLSQRTVLATVLTLVGLLILVWTSSVSTAREKDPVVVGYEKCCEWCQAHNTTDANIQKCCQRCWNYWSKHGSDAGTATTGTASPPPNGNKPVRPPLQPVGNATPPPPLGTKPIVHPVTGPVTNQNPTPSPTAQTIYAKSKPTPPQHKDHHH